MLKAVVLFFFALLAASAQAQPADAVLVNGKVVTNDGAFSLREAVAVRAALSFATEVNWIGAVAGSSTRSPAMV